MASSEQPIPSTLPEDIFKPAPARAVRAAAPSRARSFVSPATESLLRRGVLVDKYQIEEVLGVGGFAVVYRATHLLLRMQVALKLLRQEVLARRPAMREQLLDEARFTARINHPNVVRIYDATHSDELTYIVMEYIDGAPLSRRLHHGPLDPLTAVRAGLDVASGLRAGLAQGLIHRDIKPANILISRQGVAKVVDFGMALASDADAPLESSGRPLVVGTRGYMSPEQAEDSSQSDFRSDIYSLGVTLLEIVTGHRPRARSRVQAIVASPPRRFLELVHWMQAPSPLLRPASYDALIQELRGLLNELEAAQRSA